MRDCDPVHPRVDGNLEIDFACRHGDKAVLKAVKVRVLQQLAKIQMMSTYKKLFWLHIRKAGGHSIWARLPGSAYKRTRHEFQPRNFIQSDPSEWNDTLNNYNMIMGEYTFRRALFAKKFLYKEEWDSLLSFAFSRNPLDRCVSMFHYLFWRNSKLSTRLLDSIRIYRATGKASLLDAYSFDVFLDVLEQRFSKEAHSIFRPISLHFTTHTARVSEDVTDEAGKILLKRIYRLESMEAAIAEVLDEIGQAPVVIDGAQKVINYSKQRIYMPTSRQIRRVEDIYKDDFEIYENALVV